MHIAPPQSSHWQSGGAMCTTMAHCTNLWLLMLCCGAMCHSSASTKPAYYEYLRNNINLNNQIQHTKLPFWLLLKAWLVDLGPFLLHKTRCLRQQCHYTAKIYPKSGHRVYVLLQDFKNQNPVLLLLFSENIYS